MRGSDMVEPDTPDYTDAQAVVAKARERLASGDDKNAARLLSDAVYHSRDPEIERQVRELATEGLERAGRFGKGPWKEIIRTLDNLSEFRSHRRPPRHTA